MVTVVGEANSTHAIGRKVMTNVVLVVGIFVCCLGAVFMAFQNASNTRASPSCWIPVAHHLIRRLPTGLCAFGFGPTPRPCCPGAQFPISKLVSFPIYRFSFITCICAEHEQPPYQEGRRRRGKVEARLAPFSCKELCAVRR